MQRDGGLSFLGETETWNSLLKATEVQNAIQMYKVLAGIFFLKKPASEPCSSGSVM